jgi:hypothetical protein
MAGGGKGGDSYWPGFVDALTNVVIAMIFVVVVLAIALSFAAQMMGKKLAEQYIKEHTAKMTQAPPGPPPDPTEAAAPSQTVRSAPDAGAPVRARIAVAGNEAASMPLGAKVVSSRDVLQLDYAPGALTLDAAAVTQLKTALGQLGADGNKRSVQLLASGPDMVLSENQRLAYLRLLAVRNELIQAGFEPEHITMNIDTQGELPNARVNLSFKERP